MSAILALVARGAVADAPVDIAPQERTTGSLEPGKRGDFIVLDRDVFAIDPRDLHETRVRATYLDGREVYAAQAP